MFSRVEAEGFRSLKRIDRPIAPFQALVGPNASGKTTFLQVIEFLGDLIRSRGDVQSAVAARSPDFRKLLWLEKGDRFRLVVEAPVPEPVLDRVIEKWRDHSTVRYEIEIALDEDANEIGIDHETLWAFVPGTVGTRPQRDLFPGENLEFRPIFIEPLKRGRHVLAKKIKGGNDTYYPDGSDTYKPSFRVGRTQAALASVPADRDAFVVSTWFRSLLERGIQSIQLDAVALQRPSRPGLGADYRPDGSNLPWMVSTLARNERRFRRWVDHVRTALEDVDRIETVERPEDLHRYIVIRYANGARVPSWLLSDGTLRLLALTILAYLDPSDSVYLIEEPENGIHPKAIETVVESLRSVYGSQLLTATHSTVALNMLDPKDVLCVAKTSEGATDMVAGSEHPALREWRKGQPDLGVLFASGVLS